MGFSEVEMLSQGNPGLGAMMCALHTGEIPLMAAPFPVQLCLSTAYRHLRSILPILLQDFLAHTGML